MLFKLTKHTFPFFFGKQENDAFLTQVKIHIGSTLLCTFFCHIKNGKDMKKTSFSLDNFIIEKCAATYFAQSSISHTCSNLFLKVKMPFLILQHYKMQNQKWKWSFSAFEIILVMCEKYIHAFAKSSQTLFFIVLPFAISWSCRI